MTVRNFKVIRLIRIWHNCPVSNNYAREYNWTLIDSIDKFENCDFQQFDQIIILAELRWEGFRADQMYGLHVAYQLNQNFKTIRRKIILVTEFGKSFL